MVIAHSGAEALSVAADTRPAMIFMDLRMPQMSGSEALQQLRADPGFRFVPIVALTAHALEDERLAALADGFDDVIAKPCNPDELIDAVERLSRSVRQA